MNKENLEKLKRYLKAELVRRQRTAWKNVARPSQKIPPGDWRIWLILAGRGFGKTRTGSETVRQWVTSGTYQRICLLGHSLQEMRRVMIEGPSGLLSISKQYDGLDYKPYKRELIWKNGAVAQCFAATSYQQLRGPQFDGAWIDELAKFPQPKEAFDQLMFGLRLGSCPRVIITTTPAPRKFLYDLLERKDVVVTRGSTFENENNLAPSYLEDIKNTYQGTQLGAQEIDGLLLDHRPGSLWTAAVLKYTSTIPPLQRCVIAIDPAVSSGAHSDETGIIVAGQDAEGQGYILQDLSGRYCPTKALDIAASAYCECSSCEVVVETNNGGEFITDLLKLKYPGLRYHSVKAKKNKYTRAQPIALLYEQGKIYHKHCFGRLEEQMLSYTPESQASPDRLDALVWALTWLFLERPLKRRPHFWTI